MKVRYYTSSSTRSYVGEFIESVKSAKEKNKIIRDLELVEKYGLMFGNMKKLSGYNMHEISIRSYRFFCVVRGSVCWLLHAFVKKSNSTPAREIATALKRMKELDVKLSF